MANLGEGLKGGLGGAATGAALGSIIPGVGTALGGIAGGAAGLLGGLFSSDPGSNVHTPDRNDYLLPGFDARNQRLGELTNNFGQVGGQLNANLLDAATGQGGPSAAESVLQGATDRAVAGQQALAATGRGNAALLARNAMNNSANLQQQAANDAATLRANEQNAARNLFVDALEQSRNAQLGALALALNNAQSQQAGTTNYQNALLNRDMGVASMPTFGDQFMSGGAGLLGAFIGARG